MIVHQGPSYFPDISIPSQLPAILDFQITDIL